MKLLKLTFVALLFSLVSCQRDNELELVEEKQNISLEEAKEFFEKQELEKEKEGITFKLVPKWETFGNAETDYDGKSFVYVDVSIQGVPQSQKTKAMFVKNETGVEMKIIFYSDKIEDGFSVTNYKGDVLETFVGDISSKKVQKTSESGGFFLGYGGYIIIPVHVGITPEMPGVGKEDYRVEFINQLGLPLDHSQRRLYLYMISEAKISAYHGARMRENINNLIGGGKRKNTENLSEIEYQLEEVVVEYFHTKGQDEFWKLRGFLNFLYTEMTFDDIAREIEKISRMTYYEKQKKASPQGIIDKDLKNDCAKTILNQMRSDTSRINLANLIDPSKNRKFNFSQEIIDLFEESSKMDMVFRTGKTKNNANGSTKGTVITLSNSYLRSATQLSIARTMIHEMVHAYLNATYRIRGGEGNDEEMHNKLNAYYQRNKLKYGDTGRLHHEFMGEYVDAMAVSLQIWDIRYGSQTDLGFEYYRAMSFAGLAYMGKDGNDQDILIDTDSFKELVPNEAERNKIKEIIKNEQNGNKNAKGTKCK